MRISKQDIFDMCASHRMQYYYVEAWVTIVKEDDSLVISKIEWTIPKLGQEIPEEEVREAIKELELPDDVTEAGEYLVKSLFSVEYDSDDFRSWEYLVDPIAEFELHITEAEQKRQQEEWDKLGINDSCELDELFSGPSKYTQIESAIIQWSNDGTKTAGALTRELIELLKLKD